MHSKTWIQCTALLAATTLLFGNARPTHADTPLMGAAIIAAGSATIIGAAILGAGTLIAVAIVLTDEPEGDGECECPETRTEGEGDGGGTEQGGGGDTQKRVRKPSLVFQSSGASLSGSMIQPAATSFDDSTTHPGVTAFIDRKAELRVDRAPNGYAVGRVDYAFEGDILKAPSNLRKFTHNEAMVFDLIVDTSTIQNPNACVALSFKNIRLSTKDIPRTHGSVRMRIDVFEHAVKTNTREILVEQGKITQRPAWATGPGWVFAKDRVDILDGAVALPCTPNPSGDPTSMRVAVNMEFVGAHQ